MIEADVIEPWDNYIPQGGHRRHDPLDPGGVHGRRQALQLAVPARRDRHGLAFGPHGARPGCRTRRPRPGTSTCRTPRRWSNSGAAPFGATFDAHGWRSLAPMTHSLSSDVYTSEGLFDFTSDPAVEALMLMKEIMALSHPDILLAGATDGGVNGTPDEVAFAAQRVGYYTKYFNAPLRMAQYWDDPTQLKLARQPKFAERRGLDGVLDHRLLPAQARREQGEGGGVRQGADLRPADLAGLDRRHRDRAPGAAAALQLDLRRLGREPARLDARVRRASCAASSTRPRRSPTTSSACSSSSSASRSGRPTSRARSRTRGSRCRTWSTPCRPRCKRG